MPHESRMLPPDCGLCIRITCACQCACNWGGPGVDYLSVVYAQVLAAARTGGFSLRTFAVRIFGRISVGSPFDGPFCAERLPNTRDLRVCPFSFPLRAFSQSRYGSPGGPQPILMALPRFESRLSPYPYGSSYSAPQTRSWNNVPCAVSIYVM